MKKALNIIGNIILWLFVAFAAVLTIFAISASKSASGVPNVLGKAFITIQSPSMSGTFEEGDLIIDDIADDLEEQKSYEKGDIITFKFKKQQEDGSFIEALNSHRIIDKYEEDNVIYYKTKGDNNPVEDATPVPYFNVVAKYTETKLDGFGNVLDFLRSKTGFLICIVLPLILFFIFELYKFIMIIVRSKSEQIKEDEDEIKKKAIEEYKAKLAAEQEAAKADQKPGMNEEQSSEDDVADSNTEVDSSEEKIDKE